MPQPLCDGLVLVLNVKTCEEACVHIDVSMAVLCILGALSDGHQGHGQTQH